MITTNANNLAEQIAEVTIQQMYDTIDHQLEYADIDLDGDEYYEMLEFITNKTIKNIIDYFDDINTLNI